MAICTLDIASSFNRMVEVSISLYAIPSNHVSFHKHVAANCETKGLLEDFPGDTLKLVCSWDKSLCSGSSPTSRQVAE